MGLRLLIAAPRQAQREQLYAIYSASPFVASIDVATTSEELRYKLEHTPPNFVVVHQSLITDSALLPRDRFVILATAVDQTLLLVACSHGTRDYFLENPLPAVMPLAALDPTRAAGMPEYFAQAGLPPLDELLTPCQKRVFELQQKGLSYDAIGDHLPISKYTVKTHLKNARGRLRKYDLRRKKNGV